MSRNHRRHTVCLRLIVDEEEVSKEEEEHPGHRLRPDGSEQVCVATHTEHRPHCEQREA